MNFVEQHTWTLIRSLILELDPNREGWCIDAGAGLDDYYFEWFSNHGYKTALIEPLPTLAVRQACAWHSVYLIQAALDSKDGVGTLHTLADGNLHSLHPALWGESRSSTEVLTMTLPSALDAVGIEHVTALKLDIEGAEPTVLCQLERWRLPSVLAFEFGGVHCCCEGIGAWSDGATRQLQDAVQRLPGLGYRAGLLIVASLGSEMRPLDFEDLAFEPRDAWGNIVVTTAAISAAELLERASGELLLSG